MLNIDHIMWGAPDLQTGIVEAQRLFAVTAAPGGVHPGLGTCNALLSLGRSRYLEIIAPDPAQPLTEFGRRLADLPSCQVISWAAAASELSALVSRAQSLQWSVRGPLDTSRRDDSGELLEWQLLFFRDHGFGNVVPFVIDWQSCQHPATVSPAAGALRELRLFSPQAVQLRQHFETLGLGLGLGLTVTAAEQVGIAVDIEGENGLVTLHSSSASMAIGL